MRKNRRSGGARQCNTYSGFVVRLATMLELAIAIIGFSIFLILNDDWSYDNADELTHDLPMLINYVSALIHHQLPD